MSTNFTERPGDAEGTIHVYQGERFVGAVKYHKVSRGKAAGWQTEGAVLGPLAVRYDERDDAVAALISFRIAGVPAVV